MSVFGPPKVSKLAAKGDLKGLIKALGNQRDWLVRRPAVEASTATLVEPTRPKMATGRGGDGRTRAAASTVAGAQTGPPDGMRIGTDPDVMYDLGGTLYEEGDPGRAHLVREGRSRRP
jgi:hypothetical protein